MEKKQQLWHCLFFFFFLEKQFMCIFVLFSGRIIESYATFMKNTPNLLNIILWNHRNIKVWTIISTIDNLCMHTERRYIFNAEYTRLIDHHKYYQLETIYFRWYPHSHSSICIIQLIKEMWAGKLIFRCIFTLQSLTHCNKENVMSLSKNIASPSIYCCSLSDCNIVFSQWGIQFSLRSITLKSQITLCRQDMMKYTELNQNIKKIMNTNRFHLTDASGK